LIGTLAVALKKEKGKIKGVKWGFRLINQEELKPNLTGLPLE